jgi:hypothetical protein
MSSCGCDKFERLVGLETKVYIVEFLEETSTDEESGVVYYRCRICGTPWKRAGEADQRRESLVRLETEHNV